MVVMDKMDMMVQTEAMPLHLRMVPMVGMGETEVMEGMEVKVVMVEVED